MAQCLSRLTDREARLRRNPGAARGRPEPGQARERANDTGNKTTHSNNASFPALLGSPGPGSARRATPRVPTADQGAWD